MTAHTVTCTLTVHCAWWVMPYLNTLAFMCALTGLEPDLRKARRMIEKGVMLKAKPVR
ncbi:hypothetical protein [Massilia scottii]|uniref:hypothetical protein n=1 Tax=Massilia scottii TaxID=3057166 RepID=UPI002796572E|nr:hypothetical protein [Massilia sp. CCM 9029]MDQ1835541.1 hypothetical protein [Massilia sp. CCM 9029]